jgi:serine/threonine protein kinase
VATSRNAPLAPGTSLGKYEILEYLASGGMAEIYLARVRGIEGFEKTVVLKRILPKLADDDEVVTMFLDEARLAAGLSHPNVVQIYDIGKEPEGYFFTMEYIHGEDLHTLVRRAAKEGRGLNLGNALLIVAQVAAGLHHAHDKRGADGQPLGTVHRDVSPGNVMVTHDGTAKIVDFGVAKAVARQTKTRSGAIKGTVSYMSPEQARGGEIDRRSDVFALGILLFELTTGTRLFRKAHEYAVITQLLNEPLPPPSSRRADYPPALERIVMKALQREPDERYATAQELQLAIEDFARDERIALSNVTLGRFVTEVLGDRPDPTIPAHHPTMAAKEGTVPETLSGAASQPALPLERSTRRWWGAALALVVAAGGVALLSRDDEPNPATRATSSAAVDAMRAAAASGPSSAARTSSAARAQAPPAAGAPASAAASASATASSPPADASTPQRRPAKTRPPALRRPPSAPPPAAKPSATGWDPGSVLPPVVDQ